MDAHIDKAQDNWSIEPLPNLDFKIMQGNSLIEEFEGMRLFDDRFLASDDDNKKNKIQTLTTKQFALQKEYLRLHSEQKLTMFKKAELESEIKKIGEQINALNKPEKRGGADKAGLFDIFSQAKQKIEEFKKLQKEFYSEAEHKKKNDLKKRINALERELIEATLKEQGTDSALGKLEKYKTSNSKPFFLWKLYFAEVFQGVNPGFDIVIANPPYVRQEAIKKQKQELLNAGYEVYTATSDLYTYFYEKSYQILKQSGVSAFISSNKWMRSNYGEKLRDFLNNKTTMLELIDFNGHKVFEATVDTNILIFTKKSAPDIYAVQFVNIESDFDGRNIAHYAQTHLERIPKDELKSNGWSLVNQKTLAIKKKIEKNGTPLKDWDVKIHFGIKTGFNEAFIIDTAVKEKLCWKDPNSEKILRPILRGRDIGRYFYHWQGLYLIKIESGWTDKHKGSEGAERFFQKRFPAVYEYLKDIGERCEKGAINYKGKELFSRDDQGRYWWELRDCDYYGDFEMEKIVYKDIGERLSFALDGQGFYLNNTGYFIYSAKINLKYLLCLLNSNLIAWFYQHISSQLGAKGIRHFSIYIEQIPIPQISAQHQTPFIALVNKILALTDDEDYLQNEQKKSQVREYQRQIDEMVYELYGLSEEERKVVEGG